MGDVKTQKKKVNQLLLVVAKLKLIILSENLFVISHSSFINSAGWQAGFRITCLLSSDLILILILTKMKNLWAFWIKLK